jgi:hypothetical protein
MLQWQSMENIKSDQTMLKKNQEGIKIRLDVLFIEGALVALGIFSGAGSIMEVLQYFDKVGVRGK